MRETPDQPMDADSFLFLEGIESGHFWFEARRRLLLMVLARYFGHARRYLEYGSGTGFLLQAVHERFPSWQLVGSDLQVDTLRRVARRVPAAGTLVADALAPGLAAQLDVIGAFDVIEHIADDQAVLRNMHSLLRPGGGIVIMVPQHAWLWSVADEYAGHERRYSRAELEAKVRAAGFEVLRTTSFTSLILPAMLLSRRGMPERVADYDPADEINVGPVPNWLLSRAMEAEYLLLRLGLSLPAGGSLLLAARKK